MRVQIKLQGRANAQAVFDVLHGKNVVWRELAGGWHVLTVEYADGAELLEVFLRELFPRMRLHYVRSV